MVRVEGWCGGDGDGEGGVVVGVVGTMLAQNLPRAMMTGGVSVRVLVAFWLIFAFILGVAYRGNLTASLTAPIYPARIESLSQLVASGAKSVLELVMQGWYIETPWYIDQSFETLA